PLPKPEDPKPQDTAKDADPRSKLPNHDRPDQRDATRPPPASAVGEFERKDTRGRWGLLPPKEAEDLQRRDADEFPHRYRRWMGLYSRGVNGRAKKARWRGREPRRSNVKRDTSWSLVRRIAVAAAALAAAGAFAPRAPAQAMDPDA